MISLSLFSGFNTFGDQNFVSIHYYKYFFLFKLKKETKVF